MSSGLDNFFRVYNIPDYSILYSIPFSGQVISAAVSVS